MERDTTPHPRIPLGADRKSVRISREEMHLAWLHRETTGEPIQTWVRRLIREHAPQAAKPYPDHETAAEASHPLRDSLTTDCPTGTPERNGRTG